MVPLERSYYSTFTNTQVYNNCRSIRARWWCRAAHFSIWSLIRICYKYNRKYKIKISSIIISFFKYFQTTIICKIVKNVEEPFWSVNNNLLLINIHYSSWSAYAVFAHKSFIRHKFYFLYLFFSLIKLTVNATCYFFDKH